MKLLGIFCIAGILTVSANATTIFFDNISQAVTGQDGIAPNNGNCVAPAAGNPGPPCDGNGNPNIGNLYDSFSTGVSANTTGFTLKDLKVNLIAFNKADGASVNVGLYSNNTDVPGGLVQNLGTVLDSSLNNCATSAGICQGIGTVIDLNGLSANLLDNTRYWIGLSTSGSALWNYAGDGSGTGTTGEFYYSAGNLQTADASGPYLLQVSGVDNAPFSTTPEPTTFILLGSSAIALGLFRRKIRTN